MECHKLIKLACLKEQFKLSDRGNYILLCCSLATTVHHKLNCVCQIKYKLLK